VIALPKRVVSVGVIDLIIYVAAQQVAPTCPKKIEFARHMAELEFAKFMDVDLPFGIIQEYVGMNNWEHAITLAAVCKSWRIAAEPHLAMIGCTYGGGTQEKVKCDRVSKLFGKRQSEYISTLQQVCLVIIILCLEVQVQQWPTNLLTLGNFKVGSNL